MTTEIEMQDGVWKRFEPIPDDKQDDYVLSYLQAAKAGDNSSARRLHFHLDLMLAESMGFHLTDFAREVLADMHRNLAKWHGGKTVAHEMMKVLHFSSDAGTKRTIMADMRDEQIFRDVVSTIDDHCADDKPITLTEAFQIVSDQDKTTDGLFDFQYNLSPKSISNIFYGIKPKFKNKVLGNKDTE